MHGTLIATHYINSANVYFTRTKNRIEKVLLWHTSCIYRRQTPSRALQYLNSGTKLCSTLVHAFSPAPPLLHHLSCFLLTAISFLLLPSCSFSLLYYFWSFSLSYLSFYFSNSFFLVFSLRHHPSRPFYLFSLVVALYVSTTSTFALSLLSFPSYSFPSLLFRLLSCSFSSLRV